MIAFKCLFCSNDAKIRCIKCKSAQYCSIGCQQSHWEKHEKDCREPISNLSLIENVAQKLLTNPHENGLSILHHMAMRAQCVICIYATIEECNLFMEDKIPLPKAKYVAYDSTRGSLGRYILLDIEGHDIQLGCDYNQNILDEYKDVRSLYNGPEEDTKIIAGKMIMEIIGDVYDLDICQSILQQVIDRDGDIKVNNGILETRSYKFLLYNQYKKWDGRL